MCDAPIHLPVFRSDKCRCRVWGRNQKEGIPAAVGSQCKRNAGVNGLCTQHSDPNKQHFGFYDEPRPTRWGISHDNRSLSVPSDRNLGKKIPWKKNIIPQVQRANPEPSWNRIDPHYLRARRLETQIEEQKSTIEEQKSTIEEQKSTIEEQKSTIEEQKITLRHLHLRLSNIVNSIPCHQGTNTLASEKLVSKEEDVFEDVNLYDEINFEGVKYYEVEYTGKLYNTEYQEVGTWNKYDADDIIWNSEKFKTTHQAMLQ